MSRWLGHDEFGAEAHELAHSVGHAEHGDESYESGVVGDDLVEVAALALQRFDDVDEVA